MNCFPCKGPTCNTCSKFDKINAAAALKSGVRCSLCGGRVDLSKRICLSCGQTILPPPGQSMNEHFNRQP